MGKNDPTIRDTPAEIRNRLGGLPKLAHDPPNQTPTQTQTNNKKTQTNVSSKETFAEAQED